jgi:hypothetical protein
VADTRSDRIRDHIRREILSGRVAPGGRLPTERQLADRYGVSLTTVNKVMAGLELEGLLERRRGTGTYVREELAEGALAIVLGPPNAPPGPRLRAAIARAAIDAAARSTPGVQTYLAAGPEGVEGSPLARDASAGRLCGALLLGVSPAVAAGVDRIGVPFVRLMGAGPGPAVGVAWRDAAKDALRRMAGNGAWPAAVQLPLGPAGREMAEAAAEVAAEAGDAFDETLLAAADGPEGWGWALKTVRRPQVRSLALLGDEPDAALAAAASVRGEPNQLEAVLVRTIDGCFAGDAVPFARLDVGTEAMAHASLALLAEIRGGKEAGDRSRTVRPRYLPAEARW